MNNKINYNKVVNLFYLYNKIVLNNNLKPRNLGTNQIEALEKFIKQVPYGIKGYLKWKKFKILNKEGELVNRFTLHLITKNQEKKLNISRTKNNLMSNATLRQKLEFLSYSGVIEWFLIGKHISKSQEWKTKIHLIWDNINKNEYNPITIFYLALLNETKKRKEWNQSKISMATSYILNWFDNFSDISRKGQGTFALLNNLKENISKNVVLKGKKRPPTKEIKLFLLVNDGRNNYKKINEKVLYKNGKRSLENLIKNLIHSLDLSKNKEYHFIKERATEIYNDAMKKNLRKGHRDWKQQSIISRKMFDRNKDDMGKYELRKTDLVEAAHIIGVKESKTKIIQNFRKNNYEKVCKVYDRLYSLRNCLILPVEAHTLLDGGYIKIYNCGTMYNVEKKMIIGKLEYTPPNSFLPQNPHKNL